MDDTVKACESMGQDRDAATGHKHSRRGLVPRPRVPLLGRGLEHRTNRGQFKEGVFYDAIDHSNSAQPTSQGRDNVTEVVS